MRSSLASTSMPQSSWPPVVAAMGRPPSELPGNSPSEMPGDAPAEGSPDTPQEYPPESPPEAEPETPTELPADQPPPESVAAGRLAHDPITILNAHISQQGFHPFATS